MSWTINKHWISWFSHFKNNWSFAKGRLLLNVTTVVQKYIRFEEDSKDGLSRYPLQLKDLSCNNSGSQGAVIQAARYGGIFVDFGGTFSDLVIRFLPRRNVVGRMRLKRTRAKKRRAKYRCLWNLTKDKGIGRPPTSRWEVLEVEAPSNGSVNFRAR